MEPNVYYLTQSILKAVTESEVELLLNSFVDENFLVTPTGKPASFSAVKRNIKKLRNHFESLIFLNAEPSLTKNGVHYSVTYLKQKENEF